MKKSVILLVLLFWGSLSFGQTFDLNLTAKMLRDNGVWKKNSVVNIRKFVHGMEKTPNGVLVEQFFLEDDKGNKVNIKSKVSDCFDFQYNDIQQLWDANIITNVLYKLTQNGFQYDLRAELEDEALEYIRMVKEYGLEFNDPYLEAYIYNLVAKISPQQLIDGRSASLNILIQTDPSINACCFPNGTIVLNTGLLATLHSEDELVAILAHEIAHFVLDHSVQNVNAAEQRQRRAEFWADLFLGATAAVEGYIASQNEYYVPGAATLSMAVLSASITSQVVDRLGLKYNHEQENEADKLAVQVLKILGYNENALATALSRLEEEYIRERNNAMYVSSYTHPALTERIQKAGEPEQVKDDDYERMVSFAVSNVAQMKYENRRFRQCLMYVSQNINNNVASVDDYIIKANCLLFTKDDADSNMEAIALINKAKAIDPNNINIYKAEIIAVLRSGDKEKSLELVNQYIDRLDASSLDEIKSDGAWEVYYNFLTSESIWAHQMVVKLKGM